MRQYDTLASCTEGLGWKAVARGCEYARVCGQVVGSTGRVDLGGAATMVAVAVSF